MAEELDRIQKEIAELKARWPPVQYKLSSNYEYDVNWLSVVSVGERTESQSRDDDSSLSPSLLTDLAEDRQCLFQFVVSHFM